MPEDTFLRAIVTQAWQIAVLTIIVALLVRFFAAKTPQIACWLWLIVIVKCVTPPLWGHSLGLFSQVQTVVANGDVSTIETDAPAAEVGITARFAPGSSADDLDMYPVEPEDVAFSFEPEFQTNEFETITDNDRAGLLDVWAFTTWLLIAGMIVSMLWLSWKFACCLRRIHAHRVTEFDDEIESVVATLAKELRLRRVPRVIISDVRFGPAVLGIFRHLIVLPKCLIADEGCRDPKTLRPILAHELLHIRRGDLWTGTLQAVVQCLWWFHPAVWIVNRLLSRETERSCDEQVVAELDCSPMDYARSLLAVIECKHRLKPIPVFPGMKPVEITSQRMERIMSLTQGSRTRMPWWSVVAIVLFAAVVLPGAVVGQQVNELATVEGEQDAEVTHLSERTLDSDFEEVYPQNEDGDGNMPSGPSGFGMLDVITLADLSAVGPGEIAELLKSARANGFSATTFVASVNGQPVLVDDVLAPLRYSIESDTAISSEQKSLVLEAQLKARLDNYIDEEIVLQEIEEAISEDRIALVEEALEEPFLKEIARYMEIHHLTSNEGLEESLIEQGASLGLIRKRFFRAKKVAGYFSTLHEPSLERGERRRVCQKVLDDLRAKATIFTIFDRPSEKESGDEPKLRFAEGREDELLTAAEQVETASESEQKSGSAMGSKGLDLLEASQNSAPALPVVNKEMFGVGVNSDAGVSGDLTQKVGAIGASLDSSVELMNSKPPYNAKVAVSRAWLRSGAGNPFYATSILGKGSVVRIERYESNGYCMVKPTKKCFSWVSTRYVRKTESGKGVVVNSQPVVFVGSSLKATANVWQVRLKAGDAVKILGNQQVHTINGAMSAYRIEPPDGEYRWIRASALVPTDEGACVVDPEERFELQVYRVADLVVPIRENVGPVRVGSALMMASKEKPQPLRADDNSMDELILNGNAADFTGLIELIRTTVEPDSWTDEGGRIVPNVKTLSLVIRQKPEVHDKVVDLVQQLRSLQGRTVSTEFRILRFDTPKQMDWLHTNLKFHKTPKSYPWLLLPRSKSTKILTDAKENSTEISAPRITTLGGQAASLQVTGTIETSLLRLKATRLSGDQLIELEYGVSVAQSQNDQLQIVRRIVGNEQTMILDVTDMFSEEERSGIRVVAAITSSIVSEVDYP